VNNKWNRRYLQERKSQYLGCHLYTLQLAGPIGIGRSRCNDYRLVVLLYGKLIPSYLNFQRLLWCCFYSIVDTLWYIHGCLVEGLQLPDKLPFLYIHWVASEGRGWQLQLEYLLSDLLPHLDSVRRHFVLPLHKL